MNLTLTALHDCDVRTDASENDEEARQRGRKGGRTRVTSEAVAAPEDSANLGAVPEDSVNLVAVDDMTTWYPFPTQSSLGTCIIALLLQAFKKKKLSPQEHIKDGESGRSSLHRSLRFGHLVVASVLLKSEASVSIEDSKSRTPVDLLSGPVLQANGNGDGSVVTELYNW